MRLLKIRKSYGVRFSPDGKFCLVLGRDANLWNLSSRKKVWKVLPLFYPYHGSFSPDGSIIAVKNTEGSIIILDRATGALIKDFANKSEDEGSNVVFSPEGEYLVDGSWNGLLTVRKIFTGRIKYQKTFTDEMICQVSGANKGKIWVTLHWPKRPAGSDKSLPANDFFLKWLWPIGDIAPDRLTFEFPRIVSFTLNQCGNRLVAVYGIPPTKIVALNVEAKSVLWTQELTAGGYGSKIKWSQCEKYLAVVQESRIAFYESSGGSLLGFHAIEFPSDVDFSPDSSLVACGSWQNGIILPFIPEQLEQKSQ